MSKKRSDLPKGKGENKQEGIDEPYKISRFDKIPFWLKAIFVKYWFFGAIYFFFVMGILSLGQSSNNWVKVLVVGAATGFINEFFVNNILGAMSTPANEARLWWMIHGKRFYHFLLSVLYGFLLGAGTMLLCAYLLHAVFPGLHGVFQEPLSFAAVALLLDLAATWLKNLIAFLLRYGHPQEEGGDLQ